MFFCFGLSLETATHMLFQMVNLVVLNRLVVFESDGFALLTGVSHWSAKENIGFMAEDTCS